MTPQRSESGSIAKTLGFLDIRPMFGTFGSTRSYLGEVPTDLWQVHDLRSRDVVTRSRVILSISNGVCRRPALTDRRLDRRTLVVLPCPRPSPAFAPRSLHGADAVLAVRRSSRPPPLIVPSGLSPSRRVSKADARLLHPLPRQFCRQGPVGFGKPATAAVCPRRRVTAR